eukprot:g13794.t1
MKLTMSPSCELSEVPTETNSTDTNGPVIFGSQILKTGNGDAGYLELLGDLLQIKYRSPRVSSKYVLEEDSNEYLLYFAVKADKGSQKVRVGAKVGQVLEIVAESDRARRQTKVDANRARWLEQTGATRGRGTKASQVEPMCAEGPDNRVHAELR